LAELYITLTICTTFPQIKPKRYITVIQRCNRFRLYNVSEIVTVCTTFPKIFGHFFLLRQRGGGQGRIRVESELGIGLWLGIGIRIWLGLGLGIGGGGNKAFHSPVYDYKQFECRNNPGPNR
jgi:hypothetical protein